MKYNTFRALLIGGGILVVGAGITGAALTCSSDDPKGKAASATNAAPKRSAAPSASGEVAAKPPATAATSAPTTPEGAIRPVDTAVLAKLREKLLGDKVKDVFPGAAYKVSLYQDAGKALPNRLKIDLDRDEKWDEKWTIETEDGKEKIKRQVAPNDDENYSLEYRLENQAWIPKNK